MIESSSGFNLKKEMEILSQIEKELKEKPELVIVRKSAVIEEATPKQEDEDEDEVLIEERKHQ